MPQTKRVTAQRGGRLDCGHLIAPGQVLHVIKLFTCDQAECSVRDVLLAACAALARRAQAQGPKALSAQAKPAQTNSQG